ncbi:MAG: hypothetical protein JOY69_05210 [Candidatus Eremiobacteraeota bacterium]|nr:hypothetical protein [Candidatus Eremiobacteraeota bacterium]
MRRALVAIVAVLAGCVSPPQATVTQPGGPPARIQLARAVASTPFAGVLAQYDTDIATLRRVANDPGFGNLHGRIEASARDVDRRVRASTARVAGLRAQSVALPASEPRRDFGSGVAGEFAQAAQSRVARAIALRATQLREHEATVAYDFERAHAGRRLVLGLKLRDLHLDTATRRRYRAQLDALDQQEAAMIATERNRDDRILAAYGAQLRAQAVADSASMASDLAEHARAMQTIPRPQTNALPATLRHPADTRAPTLTAFENVRRHLSARLHDLRDADDATRTDVAREIADLQRERDALRAEIVASIEARAARVAAAQHLGRVYTGTAPPGARDITDAVVRSYSLSTGS